jgi:protein ImuB
VERSVQEILAILRKWGIQTLGQLAALDREALRARLGNEAVALWLRANGQAMRLLKLVQPPETFEETFEFDHEIETAEPLLFMLRRFLEQLALRLGGIYLVAQQLTLRIAFSNKQSYERAFQIPQPTNDVDLLFRMLQTHLEDFKSKQPIVAVALSAEPIRPVSQQFGLFETALRDPHQLYETLARLTALLGAERVGTPVREETHRPDAFRMEPFAWVVASAVSSGKFRQSSSESDALRTAHATARPTLRRFRPAAQAAVFSSENTPVHIHSDTVLEGARAVDAAQGPYLLSGNWWDEKSWARAEWDLQLESGELVRAHEANPPSQNGSDGVASGTWKIDGMYD